MGTDRLNLADPAFEPTDAQLEELSRRAFAQVRRRNAEAAEKLAATIETRRAAVLQRIAGVQPAAARSR